MKTFTRVEPTITQQFGKKFIRTAVIKHFQTEDGEKHEFTTFQKEFSKDVAVLALTTDLQVIISYQFRPGPERWLYELPGGDLLDNEAPEVGARRELHEETGYTSETFQLLGTAARNAYTNETTHYYVAHGCSLASTGQILDEEERAQGLEVRLISIHELIDYAKHGLMTDGIAVLMAYDKLKELIHGTTKKSY